MRYRWVAKDQQGALKEGEARGESANEISRQLSSQGLTPVEIKKAGEEAAATTRTGAPDAQPRPGRPLPRGRSLVKPIDLAAFFRSLKSSVSAGLPLARTFEIVLHTVHNSRIRSLASELQSTVREGQSFVEAMARRTDVVPYFSLGVLKAGEASGHLEEALENLAEHYEHEHELMQEIRWKTALPKVELGCFLILIGPMPFIFAWASRQATKSGFKFDMNLSLPILMLVGLAIVIFGGLLFYQFAKNIRPVALCFDWLKLYVPGLAGLNRRLGISRFMNMLALCVRSGLSYHEAAELALPVVGNTVLQSRLQAIIPRLRQGTRLTEVLEPLGLVPFQAMQMLYTGEDTGDTDQMLQTAARELQQQARSDLRVLAIVLSGAMLAIVRVLAGILVISFWVQYYGAMLSITD